VTPAVWPRDDPRTTRMLQIEPPQARFTDGAIGDLRTRLRSGDLLVVNDAATLPASFPGVTAAGAPVEARLVEPAEGGSWRAVLFGAGYWRTRTEDRPSPPPLGVGESLRFDGLVATVSHVDPASPRLVSLVFDLRDAALWSALYRAGRPVQYAHTSRPLALWHVQTAYASRPWAVEAPSAGFALTWDLLLALRRQGVGLARVTHAAGLSATGDEALDARLPLAERYEVPGETVRAIRVARAQGARVIAVGTTVARALEGAVVNGGGRLRPGVGTTDLRLGPGSRRRVVDGILTGVHDAGTSHFELLQAFAPRALLESAQAFSERCSYRGHEFGDAVLVLAASRSVEMDDAALEGDADRHRPVAGAQLLQDVRHVPLDRPRAHPQGGGEILVGATAGQQA
jgi:S-adenosylmethionine:tRNA ribosyltransferase-isomerase